MKMDALGPDGDDGDTVAPTGPRCVMTLYVGTEQDIINQTYAHMIPQECVMLLGM